MSINPEPFPECDGCPGYKVVKDCSFQIDGFNCSFVKDARTDKSSAGKWIKCTGCSRKGTCETKSPSPVGGCYNGWLQPTTTATEKRITPLNVCELCKSCASHGQCYYQNNIIVRGCPKFLDKQGLLPPSLHVNHPAFASTVKSQLTSEELIQRFQNLCTEMVSTVKAKNADYAGTDGDPFSNFTLVERAGVCTTEQGLLVRMSDKYARVTNLLVNNKDPQVKTESVADTLTDLAAYCLLQRIYVEVKAELAKPTKGSNTRDVENEIDWKITDCNKSQNNGVIDGCEVTPSEDKDMILITEGKVLIDNTEVPIGSMPFTITRPAFGRCRTSIIVVDINGVVSQVDGIESLASHSLSYHVPGGPPFSTKDVIVLCWIQLQGDLSEVICKDNILQQVNITREVAYK